MGGIIICGAHVGFPVCTFSLFQGLDELYDEETIKEITSTLEPHTTLAQYQFARPHNYEYYAHHYKLRNQAAAKIRGGITSGGEAEVVAEQAFSDPLWNPNGQLNNMSTQQRVLAGVGFVGILGAMRMVK